MSRRPSHRSVTFFGAPREEQPGLRVTAPRTRRRWWHPVYFRTSWARFGGKPADATGEYVVAQPGPDRSVDWGDRHPPGRIRSAGVESFTRINQDMNACRDVRE